MSAKVFFIGAGPGDPELMTIKGKRLLESADIIIWAGSLINPQVITFNKDAEIYNSAGLNLDEIKSIFSRAKRENKIVARLQSGDLSFYSAIQEQIGWLNENGIDFEVVPGVGSLAAAAASLKIELTQPGVSQTVIVSRLAGRTLVPDRENLEKLAFHKSTLCLYLSVHLIDEVVASLVPIYGPKTPAAVVERASWPEERVITATLGELAAKVKAEGMTRTAIIIVGEALNGLGENSKLYDADFFHGCRRVNQ